MSLLGDVLLEELVHAAPGAPFRGLLAKHGPILPSELDLLAERARDRDAHVRRNATALLTLAHTDDRFALLRVLARETGDDEVFAIAAAALPDARGTAIAAAERVRRALDASDPRAAAAAVRLAWLGELDGIEDELVARFEHGDARVREAVMAILAHAGAGRLAPRLRAILVDPTARAHSDLGAIYEALLRDDDPANGEAIAASMVDADAATQVALTNAVAAVPLSPWIRALLRTQAAGTGPWRWAALRALARDAETPRGELVAVCRTYLADALTRIPAREQGLDEGLSACAWFLGTLAGHPFADRHAMRAFAEQWTPPT